MSEFSNLEFRFCRLLSTFDGVGGRVADLQTIRSRSQPSLQLGQIKFAGFCMGSCNNTDPLLNDALVVYSLSGWQLFTVRYMVTYGLLVVDHT
jgi:hypothetical protein